MAGSSDRASVESMALVPAITATLLAPTAPHTPAAGMTDPNAWLMPPPSGPTQVDLGAYTYWMHCMVCHGDQGQGLALFRSYYPKADQNCAASKCHGGPNPGAGFSFPDAPPIIGPGTLSRFVTAADLDAFIRMRMPYQAPGTLSTDEYWALAAFLLQRRGALVSGTWLNATTAPSLRVTP